MCETSSVESKSWPQSDCKVIIQSQQNRSLGVVNGDIVSACFVRVKRGRYEVTWRGGSGVI